MLASIINDKDNRYKFIYLDELDNSYRLSGFELFKNQVFPLDENVFSIFGFFAMGKNNKYVGIEEGYNVYYDAESGFYHYFKDEKEDLFKFYMNNGEDVTLYSSETSEEENKTKRFPAKKFVLALGTVICTSFMAFTILYAKNLKEVECHFDGDIVCVKIDGMFDTVKIYNEEDEISFSQGTIEEDIKKAINSSSRLNDDEKSLLYNSEFISDATFYNKDNNYQYYTLAKCFELGLVPYYGEDETLGYYAGGNDLFVKNYDRRKIKESETIRVVGHEFIHLFQVSDYPLISEASAEIMTHEYYLDNASNEGEFSYSKECKYLKILMEIIGVEPIVECNFKCNSTSLEDAVEPYLSSSDYLDFISLISLKPNDERLLNGGYDRYYELLSTLYSNKYGRDISEDEVINVINSDYSLYNRSYFRKSLVLNSPSYYLDYQEVDLEEAESKGIVEFYKLIKQEKTKDFRFDDPDINYFSERLVCRNGVSVVKDSVVKRGTSYSGEIVIKDEFGEEITLEINEAIKLGYIKLYYILQEKVTSTEFMNFYNADEYEFYAATKDGYRFDYDRLKVICLNESEEVYIPSIYEKTNEEVNTNNSVLS